MATSILLSIYTQRLIEMLPTPFLYKALQLMFVPLVYSSILQKIKECRVNLIA